jgi:tetratricopeptide (TPR) repeat protein
VLEILGGTAGRLITIHGSGGVGKSRFALEVARLAFEHDPSWQGVHLVQLEFLENADGLPAPIAVALDLPPPTGNDPFAALASSMGHSRRLLVLDNFEHLIEAASALPRLLSACSGLAFIITSRERLNLRAEWVLDLEGLPIAPHNATLEEQRVSPAVSLFMDRARHARINLEFDADHLQDAVRICELTDGYPLALELAAASLRTVPLAELARTLNSTALDLESPHRDSLDRHRSVRTAFEHSWQRLSAAERRGLACLASFQGGFIREAALAVANVDGHALEGFADRSLVQTSPNGRFGFHPLLHSFLRSKLSADLTLEKHALERHALYFGNILQSLNVQAHGAADAGVMDYMASEEGNLVALLRYSLQHQHFDTLANLAEPFLWYMPLRGRFAEALQLNVEMLEGLPRNDPAANGALAASLANASWLYRLVGDLEQAVALARQALQLVETSGNTLQHMRVLDGLGQALFLSGSFEAGITKVGKALEIARGYGDDTRLLRALSNLGAGYTTSGEMDQATRFYSEARELYDTGHVSKGMDVVWLLSNIAYQKLLLAEFDAIITLCDEALGVAREARCDGQMTLLWALVAFARLERYLEHHEPNDLEVAEATCNHAIPIARQSGEKFSGVMLLNVEGRITLEYGNATHATQLLLEGLKMALESGNRIAFSWALPYYIEAVIAVGKVEKAAELIGFIAAQPSNGVWMKARVARLEATLETRFDDQELFEAKKARGLLLSSESTKEHLLAILEITGNHSLL